MANFGGVSVEIGDLHLLGIFMNRRILIHRPAPAARLNVEPIAFAFAFSIGLEACGEYPVVLD